MTAERLRSAIVRVFSLLFTAVLVVCVLAFGVIAVGPHLFDYRTSTMLTGSMEPGITPGDVVVTTPQLASEVEVGDVISYHIPVEDHRVETHRVVEVIHNDDGTIAVRTQGDANGAPDPWVATLEGDTVWEMQAVVPWVGTGIRFLRQPVIQENIFWIAMVLLLGLGLSMIWGREEVGGSMSNDPYAAALAELTEDLDAQHAALYAEMWMEMLPERVERIGRAISARDLEAGIDTTLSLKVSSASLGAVELSEMAAGIEAAIREGDWSAADDISSHLVGVADTSREDLTSCLPA